MTASYLILNSPQTLMWSGKIYGGTSGKGGIREDKKEGDGATPVGVFPLRQVFYRPDKVSPFPCALPLIPLTPMDGWCDDPADPKYNQFIKLPYPARHEHLWRDDHVYDIIVVLGYNDDPPIPGKGSAIFMHLIREDHSPTEGCIALKKEDLIEILTTISKETNLCVIP